MRAAAAFAAAYGFPPSACGSKEEAIGLLANLGWARAGKAMEIARGAASVLNADALANLLADMEAPASAISEAKFAAMRQQATQNR